MSLPEPGFAQREECACALDEADWPAVALDVRDGVPYEVVLSRLRSLGEGDSEAAEIVAEYAS